MNKLEQRLFDEFLQDNTPKETLQDVAEVYADIAVRIALELAEKAFHSGAIENLNLYSFEDFKKEIL